MAWTDELTIEVTTGDIFDAEVDVFACTVMKDFRAYGKISKELIRKLGKRAPAFFDEAKAQYGHAELTLGDAVGLPIEGVGGITPRGIILAALWDTANPYDDNLLRKIHATILRTSFRVGARSLALPILNVPRAQLVRQVVSVVTSFDELKGADDFPTQRLMFITDSDGKAAEFRTLLEDSDLSYTLAE